jgi:MFS family permease
LVRFRRLLVHRDFRLLLLAQTFTMFGDVALVLVLGIWMKDLTGSNAAAGTVFLVYTLPTIITPLAGPVIDRFPRRRIMIVNDFVTMAIALSLLLVRSRADTWVIYVVAFFYGAVQIIFFAARSGLLVSMLPEDQLPEANGLLESIRHGLRIVGPLVGAALFALWGGGAVAILDASMFLVSAALLSLIRAPDLERRAPEGSIRDELTEGVRHILRTIDIRLVVFYTSAVLAVLGIAEVAVFALIDDGLGRPPAFLGVLSTVEGIGAILGGLTAAVAMSRLGEVRLAAVALAGFGIGMGLNATATLDVVLVAAVFTGIGVAYYFVAYQTLLQRRTPLELQGRVFTAAEAITTLPYSLSIGVGAIVVDLVDFRLLYLTVAFACVLGGGLLFRAVAERSSAQATTPGAPQRSSAPASPPLAPEAVAADPDPPAGTSLVG